MTLHLLSFLGTGTYISTRYQFNQQECETPFVNCALVQFLEATHLSVFVTTAARAKNLAALSAELTAQATCPLSAIDIPDGNSESEIWQIFDAVVATVPANSRIAFDITHGFRSLPLIVFLAAAFLRKARNVAIEGLYYGAFQPGQAITPIIDLTPTLALLDWLTATDAFLQTGSATQLGELLEERHIDLFRQQSEQLPKLLRNFGKTLKNLTQALDLVRPIELLETTAYLQSLSVDSEVTTFVKPFELLLSEVRLDVTTFALENPREAEPTAFIQALWSVLQWYVRHQRFTQALLLAREWIVTVLAHAENLDYLRAESRDIIEQQLSRMAYPPANLSQAIATHVEKPEMLAGLWSRLSTFRNDVAHCQFSNNPQSAANLARFITDDLLQQLSDLFPSVQP